MRNDLIVWKCLVNALRSRQEANRLGYAVSPPLRCSRRFEGASITRRVCPGPYKAGHIQHDLQYSTTILAERVGQGPCTLELPS